MMVSNQKATFVCSECGSPMHRLPGSIQAIYVCPVCGFSVDEENIYQKEPEETDHSHDKQFLIKSLFTDQFMNKYTRFANLSEFFHSCHFVKEEQEEALDHILEIIPRRKLNAYVRKNTRFQTWDEMFEKAVEIYLKL